jgi:hypothetical protein
MKTGSNVPTFAENNERNATTTMIDEALQVIAITTLKRRVK